MKKYLMMMAASASVLFSACSADSDLLDANNSTDSKTSEIGFNIVANKSRATIYSKAEDFAKQDNKFRVWCFDTGNAGNAYMNGTEIKCTVTTGGDKSTATWGYDKDEDKRYWTNTALNFYATFPSSIITKMNQVSDGENANKGISSGFTYTTVNEYGTNETKTNTDLLYACALNQKKGNGSDIKTNGTTNQTNYVTMQFKHALAQLNFKVKENFDSKISHTVTLHSITIKNVKPTGNFTYPSASTTESNNSTASVTANGTAADVNVKIAESGDVTVSSSGNDFSSSPILVIPQEFGSYNEKNNSAIVLEVEYKVESNGSYIKGSKDGWETAIIKLTDYNNATKWEMGKKYTYTINFTPAASDADLIMFDAAVTPWEEVSVDNITVK